MTKEQFIELGITEELATKAAEASKNELRGFIPKDRFEEVNEAKKRAEAELEERDSQLEDIKKSAGDNEDLKKQITELQNAAKEAEENYKQQLAETKMSNAIKVAIAGKVHDEELVAGLFDRTKMILGDDGKVMGLDEQFKSLKESKAFLFKDESKQEEKPGFHKLGGDPPGNNKDSGTMSLKEAIAAHYQQ